MKFREFVIDRRASDIKVLPLSSHDDRVRLAIYRAIYGDSTPFCPVPGWRGAYLPGYRLRWRAKRERRAEGSDVG
jgi:hypothetical protein